MTAALALPAPALDAQEGPEWDVRLEAFTRDGLVRKIVRVRAFSDFGAYWAAVFNQPLHWRVGAITAINRRESKK